LKPIGPTGCLFYSNRVERRIFHRVAIIPVLRKVGGSVAEE
jgi:hypothetical protein